MERDVDKHAEARDRKRARRIPIHGKAYVRSVTDAVRKRAKKVRDEYQ